MSIGISGSVTGAATSRAASAGRVTTSPPGCARATPASRRAAWPSASVCTPCRAAAAAGRPGRPGRVGRGQRRRGEHLRRARRRPRARGSPGRPPTPAAASRASTSVVRNSSSTQRPDRVERRPACRRCDSSVPSPRRSTQRRGVVAVVGQLLDALGRDRGQHRVAASRAAARTARAARSRTTSSRTIVVAKSPFGALDEPHVAELVGRRGRTPARPRRHRRPSAAPARRRRPRRRGPAAAGPGRAGRARCWPARSPPRAPARGAPLGEPLGADQRVVAEHQAVRREVGGVDAVGDGRVDAGQRVVEAGAERPLGVVAVAVVSAVVDASCSSLGRSSAPLTCAGRRRGCRRTSGAGRPCRRSGANSGSFSSGLDAVMSSARDHPDADALVAAGVDVAGVRAAPSRRRRRAASRRARG